MTTSVLNVGDEVERCIDGDWFPARVVDITEMESFHKDGTSDVSYKYDIRYQDDGKVEAYVDREDISLMHKIDTRTRLIYEPGVIGAASPRRPASTQTTIPRFFPGSVDRYKARADIHTAVGGEGRGGDASPNPASEDYKHSRGSPDSLVLQRPTISLEVFRQLHQEFSRSRGDSALLRSWDDFCDSFVGYARADTRRLRRHSFAASSPTVGGRLLPIAIRFDPFSSRCEVCHKWTIYRCQRCSSAYYCGRMCQAEAWPSHSQCCDEREFRIQLNYDKIVARHARLACVASSTEEGGRGRGSVSGCLSMNPMHKIREAGSIANTYSPGSIALINNTARVNMNTGLSSIDSHGAAPLEIEMTYRDSWYDNVKRAGERKTKAVDVIKEEDCEEVETQGYSADYDSGPDMELSTPQFIGPQPANYLTPPRAQTTAFLSNKFSAEDVASLACTLNVHVDAAMDALKRCEGDANAAAEWLLSMPSYVEVNRPITSDRQVCSYPSHNVNIIEADLESNSTYVINEKPGSTADTDDDSGTDGLELFAGQFNIRGRTCDVVVTQRSHVDYTTTITIYPKGHCVLRPCAEVTDKEVKTIIKSTATGEIMRTSVLNSDLKAAAIGPNTEGVPAGFFVAHLPPPTSIDLTAIDDDVYSNVAHASAPRDHVLLVQHSSLQLVLQNICNVEAMSWNGLMEISDTANFQRARYLLQALIPQFVNPFGTMSVSSDRQISTVPIGGLTHFPNYYILVYKLFEINKVLSAQSVRPERVYIQLGSFDSLGLRSVSNEQCREELFRGSRVEPAPFLSSNPFDEEIKSDRYIGDDSIPDLIDMSTDTTSNNDIKKEDIQMIIDMFGLTPAKARNFLEKAHGSVEAAANLILNGL